MINTERLRQAITKFKFRSTPNSGRGSMPATVEDIERLSKSTAKVLEEFVDELEQSK